MYYNFIPAALAAAGLSWLTNGFILRLGRGGVVYLAPAAEEIAKTGLAIAVGASVPATHILFGLLEALWDGAGKKDIPAGLAALLGHTLFGLITYLTLLFSGSAVPALFFAYIAHMGWNTMVLYLTGRQKNNAVK